MIYYVYYFANNAVYNSARNVNSNLKKGVVMTQLTYYDCEILDYKFFTLNIVMSAFTEGCVKSEDGQYMGVCSELQYQAYTRCKHELL